jgi:amidase
MTILDRDKLNAFCRHNHVELAGAAHGPLAGTTFGLKDIFDVAGVRTGFGNPDWLETHPVPERNAPVLERLLQAGAGLVGKTHTDELAFSLNGSNAHYGQPVNVNAPGRLAGGSSSGSAAAVAGGLCDFAIGSDTGGSVRLPASFCGVYGLRATHGRIPLDHVCALAPSFDTVGWFARDMAMFARVGDVLLADGWHAPALDRVLIADDAFALLPPAVASALAPARQRVTRVLGATRPATVSSDGLRSWFETFRIIQFAEIWRTHGDWLTRTQPRLGPGIKERLAVAAALDPADIAKAEHAREEIAKRVAGLLEDRAFLVLPTAPGIAITADAPLAELEDFRGRAMSLLCIAGLARLPQISLPLARFDGCPLGMSLIGPRGADEALIAAAARIAAAE